MKRAYIGLRSVFIVILFVWQPLKAQQSVVKSYTVRDGLISNQIRSLYQDSLGYMWISTWDGLSRFDGHTFRNYTTENGLHHSVINDIVSVSGHTLLVAENDGTIDMIRRGVVDSHSLIKNIVVNKFYLSVDKTLLAATDNFGICRLLNNDFVPNEAGSQPLSIKQFFPFDQYYAVIGILGNPSGILDAQQNYIARWVLPETEFLSLYGVAKDKVWIGTSDGLFYIDLKEATNRFDLMPTINLHPSLPGHQTQVNDILQTSNHELWFGTSTGLVRLLKDGSVRHYNRLNGLINDEITCLYEDDSHTLWVGTEQGLSKINLNTSIDIYTIEKDEASNVINGVGINKAGNIFCINDLRAIYQMNAGVFQHKLSVPNANTKFYGFITPTDPRYINTNNGIVHMDGRLSTWKFPFKDQKTAFVIWADSLVYYLINQVIVTCDQTDCVLDSINMDVMATAIHPDGRIFVGSWAGGLYCGVPQAGRRTLRWEDWSVGLPEKTIRSLYLDSQNKLWVGSRYSGVVQINTNNDQREVKYHFWQKNGLSSNWVRVIHEDSLGNIWIGSHSGIDKLVRNKTGYDVYPFSRQFELYTVVNSIITDENNGVWCGTNSGLVHIVDNGSEQQQRLKVQLTRAKIGSEELLDPQSHDLITMPYNKNLATFEFALPHYFNNHQVLYQYRLIGSHDTMWSQPSNNHQVTFANLRPGKYFFEVTALTWNHELNDKAGIPFLIRAPFWERTWFLLLLLVGLVGAFYLFYKFRINQLRRIHVLRQHIATDLHDNIGSSLTHVNILAQLGKTGDVKDAKHLFHRIGEEVQSSSEALDDIIWSTQSKNDAMEDLTARMQRYGAELFDPHLTLFGIETVGLDDHQVLDMELRGDLYLIYKELLSNVVRHAKARHVRVTLSKQPPGIQLQVVDDGVGFDQLKPTSRNGLSNIRRRVEKWQGELTIKSSMNQGSDISVILRKRRSGHD